MMCIRFELQFPLLEGGDKLSATDEKNRSEDAKAAINESPWDLNTADMTRDQSKRNHSSERYSRLQGQTARER
jgi:hypothetical protein